MIRFAVAGLLFISCWPPARAAEAGQLDASPALFSVLAAINAAGYDADLTSAANHPLRAAIRKELAGRNIPSLPSLRSFFAAHRQKDWTSELRQYVSFALSVDGPPNFSYRFKPHEMPPDVIPLEGLDRLMTRFHREADLDALWQKAQPAFEETIARYHEPATRVLLEVNAYLRNPTSGYLGRRFQIYVDLLAAPNQIQARSYGDDYFLVLTPSAEPQSDDIRHGYLHYLLDPLAFKYAEALNKKKSLIDLAQAAPTLEEFYKTDFQLLATESLIKAVESRLTRGAPEKEQAVVIEALREGFILTPYFAEALPAYEKQEQSMRYYFPEMVEAIDLKREDKRLEKVEFATERRARKAKVVPAKAKPVPTGARKTLEEAEDFYTKRDLDRAREAYTLAIQQTAEKPLHAKAYYGLARIALLRNEPELAERLFGAALSSSPEPPVLAWTLVYLGRLADASGERDRATQNYQAAAKVEGASPAARAAADQGLRQAFGKPRQ